MRRTLGVLAAASLLWLSPATRAAQAAVAAPAPASAPAPVATSPAAAIDAQDALQYVKTLSAPAMEGRGALTAGLARAGDYIAARFQQLGLEGGAGAAAAGYFQDVDIPLPRRLGDGTRLALAGRTLRLGHDYAPGGAADGARAVAGMVFAGYGIVVPGRYDDYAGIDPRGKLVICLRYAPHYDVKTGQAADPAFTDGAALRAKVDAAVKRGAVAVAIVDPPAAAGADAPAPADEVAPLPGLEPHGAAGPGAPAAAAGKIASFHLGRAAADELLAPGGQTVAALAAKIEAGGQPVSFELPGYADWAVEWQRPSVRSRNVVALLEGSDPALRGEAILIGAHYDHLGRGDEGSALGPRGAIYAGADDNASGTAAVLEVAQAFAALRAPAARPRRSIIFAAFTGEEKGLLGSLAMAGRPGGKRVVAMINLDMVGRMKGQAVEVGGSSTSPDWESIVNQANQEQLALTFPKRVVPNSDHASFLTKEIPALFLFTGLHPDYHRASDTWEKINGDGLAKTARLAFRIVRAVADRDQRLAFVAPEWTHMGPFGGAHGSGVRLGVMPDYSSENGLRVTAVLPGGAGAAAGLEGGDTIQAIGGKPVADIETYMEALAGFKAGDETVVKLRRGGALRELKVKFIAAPEDEAPPPAIGGGSSGSGSGSDSATVRP